MIANQGCGHQVYHAGAGPSRELWIHKVSRICSWYAGLLFFASTTYEQLREFLKAQQAEGLNKCRFQGLLQEKQDSFLARWY